MKRRFLLVALFIIAVLACVFGLTACGEHDSGSDSQGGDKNPVEAVKITAIYLNVSSLSICIGNTETITATVLPTNATEEITWLSLDSSVATVVGGKVEGVGEGTTKIIVSSTSGVVADCTVTVSEDTNGFTFKEYGSGYAVTNYTGTDTIVTVPESYKNKFVIAIGTGFNGFRSCKNIIEVILPNCIYEINTYAFSGCSNLKKINIPRHITTINVGAFEDCSSLESIEIPNSVTVIDNWAFSGCSGLKNLTLADSVTNYNYYSFQGCINIENLIAPAIALEYIPVVNLRYAKITSGAIIHQSAFANSSKLEEVILPKSITAIGANAFINCSSLINITISDSVTSIGDSAFMGCSGLTSITIPFVGSAKSGTSYTHFGYIFGALGYDGNADYVPVSLKTVIVTGGVKVGAYSFYGCSELTQVIIPDSVTSIGEGAFRGCSGLTQVIIPDSVTSIGEGAFRGCSGLTNMTIPFVGTSESAASYDSVFGYIFGYITSSSSSTISGTIYQCYLNNKYYYYYIPQSLTSVTITGGNIGYLAFNGCSGLTNVTIGSGVTSIGSSAFKGCSNLTSVSIPDSITSIGEGAFSDCNKLSYTEFNDTLYLGNKNNPYVVLVKVTNKQIVSGVVNNCTKVIYGYAFGVCSEMTSITIPDSVTSIGERAFSGCSRLTSITIPDGVTSIGYLAFNGCSGLTNITIGSGVTSIGSSAFSGCSSLTSITIPDSVILIGSSAFEYCSELTSVTIGSGVTVLGSLAEAKTGIEVGPTVGFLPGAASVFGGCSNLDSVIFTNTVGWKISKYCTMANAQSISSSSLADPQTAAYYLTSTYCADYWQRI